MNQEEIKLCDDIIRATHKLGLLIKSKNNIHDELEFFSIRNKLQQKCLNKKLSFEESFDWSVDDFSLQLRIVIGGEIKGLVYTGLINSNAIKESISIYKEVYAEVLKL